MSVLSSETSIGRNFARPRFDHFALSSIVLASFRAQFAIARTAVGPLVRALALSASAARAAIASTFPDTSGESVGVGSRSHPKHMAPSASRQLLFDPRFNPYPRCFPANWNMLIGRSECLAAPLYRLMSQLFGTSKRGGEKKKLELHK